MSNSPAPGSIFTVWVPLPPKCLSPNDSNTNWRERSRQKIEYKAACLKAIEAAKIPCIKTPVRIHLEFYQARDPAAVVYRCKENKGKKSCRIRRKEPGLCPKCGVPLSRESTDPYARFRDRWNGSSGVKALCDQFTVAGVIVDDSARWVHPGEIEFYSTQKEHLGKIGVLVTLEVLPSNYKPDPIPRPKGGVQFRCQAYQFPNHREMASTISDKRGRSNGENTPRNMMLNINPTS